ncbi:MAG: D-aminoacylase [Thermodesulfovibrionales bacterium]|nr:D-aminoacylase [Thermodesulfovibrionales bacterium]
MPNSFLILNALCIDGSGQDPFKTNLVIKDKFISYIGKDTPKAENTIDADGLVVSPGFIDTHSHSEFTLVADSRAQGKVSQGVTTEINGNCGLSAGPIYGDAINQRKGDFLEYDIRPWKDFDEFYNRLINTGLTINFATLCGQGNLRASVKGYGKGSATSEEMKEMCVHLQNAISLGAKGLSTGLIYPPGIFTDTEELIELCCFLKSIKSDALYVPHMRSESDYLIEAIEETLEIGKNSGIGLHISHLKTGGRNNWHKIDKVVEIIDDAREMGLHITCDRYPYIASSTDLDTILPKWVFEGGVDEEIKRLQSPETLKKVKEALQNEDPLIWNEIIVSSTYRDDNKWMEGLTINEISDRLLKNPIDTVIDIILSDRARTGGIFFSMNEDNLKRFLKLPYMMIGSDSAVRNFDGITARGKPHPRGFGTFTRFIGKYIRDEGLMTLQEGIRKITSLPAKTFNLQKRGLLKEGFYADITIFDYHKIIDKAEFKNPFQKSQGIEWVFVNGTPVYANGNFTNNYPGMILQ